VSKDVEDTRGPGAKYLDSILIKLGFKGNAELSRMTGVSEGLLWKWRNDKAAPTNKSLRKVVRVIVPLCKAAGIPVDPVEFYVRFDLISRDELETEPADELFLELMRVDEEAAHIDVEAQQKLREMVWFIVDGTRKRLDEKRAAQPGTGRGSKAS
jgi:transcriptional regulator with XRE-family HTH domain